TTVVRLEGALAHSGAPEIKSVVAGAVLGVTLPPRVARIPPECTASRSPSAICAHRRQAAAAIDNSTWLRYAGLRHSVKPAVTERHYPQAGDNNLNRTR